MYNEILDLLAGSNLGSLVKLDILRNNLIKDNSDESYYLKIKQILLSKNNSFKKERELISFLKNN